MKILAVDYGTKRVGLAVSDESETLALAHGLVEPDAGRVAAEARTLGAGLIVVGLPRNMDGSLGGAARRVKRFAQQLHELAGLPVEMFDERLTSFEAEGRLRGAGGSRKKNRERVNVVAAQVILEGYLDSRRRSPTRP